MKIWLKMLIAITLGIILGILLLQFGFNSLNSIFDLIGTIAVNSLLFLTIAYILFKSFLGFLNLRKNNNITKYFGIFIICVIISVFLSIIVSIAIMNLDFFQPKYTDFPQISSKVLKLNTFGELFKRIINDNIFPSILASNDANKLIDPTAKYILPIIFVAFIFSIAAFFANKKSEYLVESIESFEQVLDKIIRQILEFFPIGAIFIVTIVIINKGIKLDIIENVENFSYENLKCIFNSLIAIGIIISIFTLIYSLCLYIFLRKNILKFYLGFFGAGLISLVTGNTAASIVPLSEHLKNNMGVKKELSDTLSPIGMILNKSGTVIVSTVILITLILIYTDDKFNLTNQMIFFVLILLYSFCLDGTNEIGFLMIVAMILNFKPLNLETNSYLLFLPFIPIFSRIATFFDTFSNAVIITITAKFTNNLEQKKYIDSI